MKSRDILIVTNFIGQHGGHKESDAWCSICEELEKSDNKAMKPCNIWREGGTCNVVASGSPCGSKPCQVSAQKQL